MIKERLKGFHSAVKWSEREDIYSLEFWEQNVMQFWVEKEFPVSDDKDDWEDMTALENDTYAKVLAGLTLLDTRQGGNGMPLMTLHAPNDQQRSVFAFMGGMEEVHAKSYSHIYITLLSNEKINEVFDWVHNNEYAQYKADRIVGIYNSIFKPVVTAREYYKALVASVFLETFLFYSGFFFPLYLAGKGKMSTSGEIINLILRDESIHGLFTGRVAQDIFDEFTPEEQEEVEKEVYDLLHELYENEVLYTKDLYDGIGLTEEVLAYVRYNANRALLNLGFDPAFEEEPINAIVETGIKAGTINHDFFSTKGNGYVKAVNVKPITDADFDFSDRL